MNHKERIQRLEPQNKLNKHVPKIQSFRVLLQELKGPQGLQLFSLNAGWLCVHFLISRTHIPLVSLGLVDFSTQGVSVGVWPGTSSVWCGSRLTLTVNFLTHPWPLRRINKTTAVRCKRPQKEAAAGSRVRGGAESPAGHPWYY